MAYYGSDKVGFILVDGYDLAGDETDLDESHEAVMEETTSLGDSYQASKATGTRKAMLTTKGFFDDDALKNVEAAVGNDGSSRTICVNVEGNVAGQRFVGWNGMLQAKTERVATRNGLHKLNSSFQGVGQRDEGYILVALAAVTGSSGNSESTPVDNGASTASGAVGYLQVKAITLGGYTNVVFKVRKSSDNISYSDMITFTAVTGRTAERATVSGTIPRYLAYSYAFSGAGTGQSVTFMVGVARN